MPVIESRIDIASETFRANAEHHLGLAADLRALVARIAIGGDEKSRDRHVQRGKLLVRDRVDRLLDPGSPFLEVGQLAAHSVYDEEVPSAGLVTGIGRIEGTLCMVVANDGLCYNRSQISNKERMWPRGRRPLLTGGEMRAISIASRAAGRLTRTAVRLQDIGLIKKPVARKPRKKS